MAFAELFSERRGGEMAGLLLAAATLLLFVSLFSHYPEDPAYFFSSGGDGFAARNLVGRFGAFLSTALYGGLGLAAFAVPATFGVLSWFYFWGRDMAPAWVRVTSAAVFTVSLTGLGELVLGTIQLFGRPFAAGGLLGSAVARLTLPVLNNFGSIVLFVTLALAAFSLATCISYRKAAGEGVQLGAALWRKARVAFFHRSEARRKMEEREEVLRRHAQRVRAEKEAQEPASSSGTVVALPRARKEKPAPGKETLFEHAGEPPAQRRGDYVFPSVALLEKPQEGTAASHEDLVERGKAIAEKLHEFGVEGNIAEIHPGPVVTTYEYTPAKGVKYSRITGLVDDLCLAMRAESILIERIPGKASVGIEVPNESRETITLRELLEDETFQRSHAKIPMALGRQVQGEPLVADLAEMPHMLVAGATGAGKSVAINTMLASMLYRLTPDELKLILIDPKRVELSVYEGVPHLYAPVIVDAKQAALVLKWLVKEMENRYRILASHGGRRNIDQFNLYLKQFGKDLRDSDGEPLRPMPYVAVVIDEFADLMMVAPREVEESVARLAQMARAVGIHLILATQRPSVDVITGVVKANFPSRISFRVSSKVDSRTVLDANGAERLLGKGDMLFLPPGSSRLKRVHGGYLSEVEVQRLVKHLKEQGHPSYHHHLEHPSRMLQENAGEGEVADGSGEEDEFYGEAVRIVVSTGAASVSNLQRRLGLGYNRAARLIDLMEANGVVGPAQGAKPRKVLVRSVES
jgi:S-DNA-T family DNA segregation ATPase FtsK/SpoIIIE